MSTTCLWDAFGTYTCGGAQQQERAQKQNVVESFESAGYAMPKMMGMMGMKGKGKDAFVEGFYQEEDAEGEMEGGKEGFCGCSGAAAGTSGGASY